MASFKTAYDIVRKIEGGYVNNPNDAGGETYKGIARNRQQSWNGWPLIDAAKKLPGNFESNLQANATLQQLVLDFYKKEFWDVMQLDQITLQSIATELFDTGVNMGTGVAVLFLQKALNATNNRGRNYPDITEDGKIGPATVRVVNAHKRPGDVLKLMNCQQGVKYMDIARNRPENEEFMSSWLSRVSLA